VDAAVVCITSENKSRYLTNLVVFIAGYIYAFLVSSSWPTSWRLGTLFTSLCDIDLKSTQPSDFIKVYLVRTLETQSIEQSTTHPPIPSANTFLDNDIMIFWSPRINTPAEVEYDPALQAVQAETPIERRKKWAACTGPN
jgi:hypothetical protein